MNRVKKCWEMLFIVIIFLLFLALHTSAETIRNGEDNIMPCAYLANGAVYQAEKPVVIWGTADSGTVITAKLYDGNNMVTESSATSVNGKWSLELQEQKGSFKEYSIKLFADNAEIAEYSNILFGEVWLSAGQSNMQLTLNDSYEGAELKKKADDNYLRVFQADSQPAFGEAIFAPAWDIDGNWIMGDKSQIGSVSAVAYNFALGLRSKLDVPVAIIETSLGSTPIESWLSKEMVDTDADLRAKMESRGVYKTEATAYKDLGAMYYSKIAPLSHLNITGVIWYQGETNVGQGRAALYERQLDLLKEKWGEAFGFENDSMPLVFTQLAPYSFSNSYDQMLLTEMMDQMSTFYSNHEATTAMITNYDVSLQYTDTLPGSVKAVIHPTVKKPIGERMALAALGLVYGEKEATAPILSTYEFVDGVAVLSFSHVGEGLNLTDESLGVLGFALCDENGVWVNATAEIINGNTVLVYSNLMKNPMHVSYAYCDMNTDANLCSSNGIPAAPFTTDSSANFGSRSYLNCDGEVFVVTSFETVGKEVGHGEYQNLWTVTNRSTNSFDSSYCVQGTSSVKVDYEAGTDEVVTGMDLLQASEYSATVGLKNIKLLSVKISNGDRREKAVRLSLKSSDGQMVFSEKQILEKGTGFDTFVFDLSKLYDEYGAAVPYSKKVCENMVEMSLCIEDEKAGTIWIDDIKFGTDDYWEPDLQGILDKLGLEREYVSNIDKNGARESNTNEMWMIIIISIVITFIIVVGIFIKRKIKR